MPLKKTLATAVFCAVIYNMFKAYRFFSKELAKLATLNLKLESNYNALLAWNKKFKSREEVVLWFLNRGYKTVGIYGAGELGNILFNSIKGSAVEVSCYINKDDGSAIIVESGIPVSQIPEILETTDLPGKKPPDVIVVTPFFAFNTINNELRKVFHNDIISIEDMTS